MRSIQGYVTLDQPYPRLGRPYCVFTLFDNAQYVRWKLEEKVDTLIHFASLVEYECTQ